MVTTLEPRVQVSIETVSPPEGLQPTGRSLEWRYAMPFAGVRVYSFRPEPPSAKVPGPVRDAFPELLKAELIDERVNLL